MTELDSKGLYANLVYVSKGMEDVPYSVLSQLNHYSKKIGFDSLLLIDSLNAWCFTGRSAN